jgi:SAM-dependent methyltransferase
MTFSKEWDERYRDNTHLSIWPWSDLVSYVMRYARPAGPDFRVLELGCGAGANIPFFESLGVKYFAIEGSPVIVERLRERFPKLGSNILAGDFTQELPFEDQFDLIVDRASLTSNTSDAIRRSLSLVLNKLKVGSTFIGIDWYSTNHTDYNRGLEAEDIYTRRDYSDGQFSHLGRIHFSDKAHLLDLFSQFSIELMEHKIVKREIPEDSHIFASWNLVAKKDEK